MHAAACATAKGRYNSSLSKYIASYCLAFKSSVIKRFCSILSAMSGVSLCSAIIFSRVDTLAILLSVVVKITEYSLEYSRKLAKPAASLVDKLLLVGCIVVPLVLSKINKHRCVLTSAI
jgi:hypothetical protein